MSKYILIAAGVALLISWGIAGLLYKQNQALHEDLATERANVVSLKGAIEEQNDTIKKMDDQRAADQREMGQLSERANAAQIEKDEAVATLNSYRDRVGKAALAKPGLVGRAASRATVGVMRQFQCASGGGEACSGGGAVPSAPAGADQPAADPN